MTTRKSLWVLMNLSAAISAIVSWRFLFGPDFFGNTTMLHFLRDMPVPTFAHFIFAPLALFIGGLQFSEKLRVSQPSIHRGLGWLYVFSCLTASVGGIILALNTISGVGVAIGFSMLSCVWFYSTFKATLLAAQGRYNDHKKWMIRSYALTFSSITFRIGFLMILPAATGLESSLCYTIGSWLCWPINIVFAEWWMRHNSSHIAGRAAA